MNATRTRRTIVLVGLMGTGKTTVARHLGKRLGLRVLDTDEMVEAAAGRSVREIFDRDGEAAFRRLESEQLHRVLWDDQPAVVAAAGGAVLSAVNRADINRLRVEGRGYVVWLTAEIEDLVSRVERGVHRPLLDDDARARLQQMGSERVDLYREVADRRVATTGRTPSEIAVEIALAVEALGPAEPPSRGPTSGERH